MGEDNQSELTEDHELVALVLSDGAVSATDHEDIEEQADVDSKIITSTVNSCLYQDADYMQRQDGVDASKFAMLAKLQAKLLTTSAAQMVQSTVLFPVIPKPF